MRRCTIETHRATKADDALWAALVLVGTQVVEADGDDPEEHLEVRNCPCGSTLARRAR